MYLVGYKLSSGEVKVQASEGNTKLRMGCTMP